MDRDPAGEHVAAFPTPHRLRAALCAGKVIIRHAGRPAEELKPAFVRTPTEAIFSSLDLELGGALLAEAGFVSFADGTVAPDGLLGSLLGEPIDEGCQILLDRLLDARRPLWVTAVAGEARIAPELLPDDAAHGLSEIFPDMAEREAFLLRLGQRFNAEELKHVGNLAEDHVVTCARAELAAAGRDDLAAQVARQSLRSDALGYDVTAPCEEGESRRLEVKGTRAQGSTVAIYLSRNEAGIALKDPRWFLVVCRVGRDDSVELVGWTTGAALADRLPTDPKTGGVWQSAELFIDIAELTGGLPEWRLPPHDA